jgi:hypothetical protein
LFDAIEKTNKGGTYGFLFHESKIEIIDNMLNNLDAALDTFGSWDYCDVHFRYLTSLPISVIGRVVTTPTSFWANHLSAFKPNGIPAEIDTQELQYSTKKRAPWVRASYSDAAKCRNAASNTSSTVANKSGQGKDNNSTESGIQDGSNHSVHPASQQRTISGLSNLERKMEEIDRERVAFKIEQSKLEEEVSTVTCSLTKLTEDILGIRREMTHMSTSLRSEIAEIKNLILNMSANKRGQKQQKKQRLRSSIHIISGTRGGKTDGSMTTSRTIWKRPGISCASLKMTETGQQGQDLHKLLTLPTRVHWLGRTDVCLTHHG